MTVPGMTVLTGIAVTAAPPGSRAAGKPRRREAAPPGSCAAGKPRRREAWKPGSLEAGKAGPAPPASRDRQRR
jgi:hypothetical protein